MLSYHLLKLVEEYGEDLTLRKNSNAAYNPATGTSSSTGTDYTFVGYFFSNSLGLLNGEVNIRRGSKNCAIPALGFTPTPNDGDQIIDGSGNKYNVLTVKTIYSNGSAVVHVCEVDE